jgi:hypothetical protein
MLALHASPPRRGSFLAARGGETELLRLALAVERTGLGERPLEPG